MTREIFPDKANRLAIGISIQREIPYEGAEEFLRSLTLRVIADERCLRSVSFQAALLTAFATGSRCFLGGVDIQLPENTPLLLPLIGFSSLNDALKLTGYEPQKMGGQPTQTIFLGDSGAQGEEGVILQCDSWRACVYDAGDTAGFEFGDGDKLGLGGIFGGGLGVHRCFMKAAGFDARCLEGPVGLSLWDPTADWRIPVAERKLNQLPIKFWVLGLGHLGQAFLWNLSIVPFPERKRVEFLLQDYDIIETANKETGLLATDKSIGRKKARNCAEWLESQGFTTVCTERAYSKHDRCSDTEPSLALCGFDSPNPRTYLEMTGFTFIVECGIGSSLNDFDCIELHTFPGNKKSPQERWGKMGARKKIVSDKIAKLFGAKEGKCGQMAIDTAGKAVSTSFIGAIAGALAISEILRLFNDGRRFDELTFTPRNPVDNDFVNSAVKLPLVKIAEMGYVNYEPEAARK